MIRQTLGLGLMAAWLVASAPVLAHHSLAGTYDIKSEGKVTGVLKKVAFTKPHGAMTVSVHNADGTDTDWVMTTGSANTLQNLGFGKDGPNTVKPGDTVTISYFAARNGKPIGFIRSITLPDKREITISNGNSNE